jgi:hypothetical protein
VEKWRIEETIAWDWSKPGPWRCNEKRLGFRTANSGPHEDDGQELQELTVRALTIGGVAQPAGTYTAETEIWIEGKGKVIVRP